MLLIMGVAIGLRLYRIGALSLSNDELSALYRLRFEDFATLIKQGVKPDGHPAGVQVFLYYWTRWMGVSEWALRLPFLGMSLAAVWLGFKLAQKWFNPTVGILFASYLAASEYMIMHSLTIRPYISGLFFALSMVVCWSSIVNKAWVVHWYHWIGYVAMSVLCCYNHYFSLLLVFWVNVSGWLLVETKYRKSYLWATLAIGVLYLPHLPIFWAQLQTGGIGGWLAAPGVDFIVRYIKFTLHYSWPLYLATLSIVIWSLFHYRYAATKRIRISLVFISWFVLSFGVGYAYALWVAPVLHFGVLFFSFPFLLLGLLGSFPTLNGVRRELIISLWLITLVFTLILDRKHYEIFYDRGAKAMVADMTTWRKQKGQDQVNTIGIAHAPFYLNYYLQSDTLDLYDLPAPDRLVEWLATRKGQHLALGWVSKMFPLTYLGLMQLYYPYLHHITYKSVSEWMLLSKIPTEAYVSEEDTLQRTWRIEQSSMDWENVVSLEDTLSGVFGPTFSTSAANMFPSSYNWITTCSQITLIDTSSATPQLVIAFEQEGQNVFWRGIPFEFSAFSQPSRRIAYWGERLRFIPLRLTEDMTFKVFIWNPSNIAYQVDQLQVTRWRGNPQLYGLVDPVP